MKILEVCVDLDGGGIDRYLYNYCSRIDGIEFHFAIVDSGKEGILEKPIIDMGGKIHRVHRLSGGIRKNYYALKKIMTENKYDAVHVHLGYKSVIALLCAKNCGINVRICHAHIAFEPENILKKVIRKISTLFVKRLSTSLLACGINAGKWVWGENTYNKGKVRVQNNAIETKKYKFCEETRNRVRDMLGISDDCFVVGHVGRLCEQKNQLRLLDIFNEIYKINNNAVLLLVGRGHLEKKVRDKAIKLGIENKVHFMGVRDDVPELLNAFDAFVFPSTHEGLPFTLIETQCNGLPVVSADTVTQEVKLGACVEFLSLDDSDVVWAKRAIEMAGRGHNAEEITNVVNAGYDIDVEAEKLKQFYLGVIDTSDERNLY